MYFSVTILTVLLFSAAAATDGKSKWLAGERGGALGDGKAMLLNFHLKDKTGSNYNADAASIKNMQ